MQNTNTQLRFQFCQKVFIMPFLTVIVYYIITSRLHFLYNS